MHDFLKFRHICDAYMGVENERKSIFLTGFEHGEKEARSLFVAQYFYRCFSECLCHLSVQYPVQLPDSGVSRE